MMCILREERLHQTS
jgi:hypothetical protein